MEIDTPFLIDSGTECSLGIDHTIDIKINTSQTKSKLSTSLIDKSFSIDEDDLCSPLEPTQVGIFHITESVSPNNSTDNTISDEDDGIADHAPIINLNKSCLQAKSSNKVFQVSNDSLSLSDQDICGEVIEHPIPIASRNSILRKPSGLESPLEGNVSICNRHVNFPNDESQLVSYRETEDEDWKISEFMSSEKILEIYRESCTKHKTIELDTIKLQLQEIKNNVNHSAVLKLSSIRITREVTETLEDILKVTNFHTLILQECQFTPQTITEFLNSLQYYNSVHNFEIAMNFENDDTWKCFCMACSQIIELHSLSFKGMVINEPYMRQLMVTIKNNPNIESLKFDGCMLVKLPTFYLVDSLMSNETIRQLYLPSTGLYAKEANVLQKLLINNTHLKVLDVSNNNLGDRGLEALSKGLYNQTVAGVGLSVLIIFNNQITEKSGLVIKNIIIKCKNLHTLNIGYNNLTDEVLFKISEALPFTQSLEGLGLQCTLLTCKGILTLSQAIISNTTLQKINLRGNKAIQITGIETLCNALTNSKISKIEIDENNRSCNDSESYSQLVKKLYAICTINKNYTDDCTNNDSSNDEDNIDEKALNISQKISRKMSLSCEPKDWAPDPNKTFQIGSPLRSPALSPSSRLTNRFQIVKVPENAKIDVESTTPIRTKSRFKVTKVPPSPEDDLHLGRFANIRSSVSSNDSTDSLATLHLDSDSESEREHS